jgi:hypothetical protein
MSDALDWTPAAALAQAQRAIAADEPDGVFIITVKDGGGQYTTDYFNSGLSVPQAVALLEYVKSQLIREMQDRDEPPPADGEGWKSV